LSPLSSASERRVAGEVEEGDRGRLLRLPRRDAPLLHEALGHGHDELEDRVLAVAALEPRDERAGELREPRRPLVRDPVLLVVREVGRHDALEHGTVEELQPGGDEPLRPATVEPRDPRELVVVDEVEGRHEVGDHLRILGADAVVRRGRQAELAAQPSQELRGATELGAQGGEGLRPLDRLGHEQLHREPQLALRDPARDVVERDSRLFERGHEADDVDARGWEEPILVGAEESQFLEASDVGARARDELRELLCRDPWHDATLACETQAARVSDERLKAYGWYCWSSEQTVSTW
jgi:hypothetical protein